jgi:hypothetical protein
MLSLNEILDCDFRHVLQLLSHEHAADAFPLGSYFAKT